MTSIFQTALLTLLAILSQKPVRTQSGTIGLKMSSSQIEKQRTMDTVYFVDRFFVPKSSKMEFVGQMIYNRNFIAGLPGYVRGEALVRTDNDGNFIIMTVAVWENQEKLDEAKRAVQAEFKRLEFNPVEFYRRLKIRVEREQYAGLK